MEVMNNEHIWEFRRYEAAKEFMSAIMGRISYNPFTAVPCCSCENINPYQGIATISVMAADALIDELKIGGDE